MTGKIVGDGNFEVYENGMIYRLGKDGSKTVPPIYTIKGEYPKVSGQYKGKQKHYSVNRLIAEAFLPNPENKPYVEIMDRNPYNCSVTNLRWLSNEERLVKSSDSRSKNKITCETCGHERVRTRSICPRCASEAKRLNAIEKRKQQKLNAIHDELGSISLDELMDKHRAVVELRMTGLSLRDIGKVVGVTGERVRSMIEEVKNGKGRFRMPKTLLGRIGFLEDKIQKLEEEKAQLEAKLLLNYGSREATE